MRQQTLTLGPDRVLGIDTPAGLILIERMPDDKRKLRLTLPEGLSAYVGEERAMDNSKYQNKDQTPKWNFLVPKTEAGRLVGVTEGKKFALGGLS